MQPGIKRFRKDDAEYSFDTHRVPEGHVVTWTCVTCGTNGGMSRVFESEEDALPAVQQAINGHHQQRHAPQADRELTALVYCSRATVVFDEQMLRDLETKSSEKNRHLEVTGYLHYDASSESFFQFLEGPRLAVEALMGEINSDSRHQVLSLHWITPLERHAAIGRNSALAMQQEVADYAEPAIHDLTRLFPDWSMRCVSRQDFRSLNLEQTLSVILVAMRAPDAGGERVCQSVAELCKELSKRISLAIKQPCKTSRLAAYEMAELPPMTEKPSKPDASAASD